MARIPVSIREEIIWLAIVPSAERVGGSVFGMVGMYAAYGAPLFIGAYELCCRERSAHSEKIDAF